MKLSYKQKLFLYFFIIFALFSIGIIVFERSQERRYKTEALEEKLDSYTEIANTFLVEENTFQQAALDSLMKLFPENLRFTLINPQGKVLYDNVLHDSENLENHAKRSEIQAATSAGKGHDIRISTSNNIEYLYYAKNFNRYYIRVALPYDVEVKYLLKTDNFFLFFILFFFILMLYPIYYTAERFGKSIKQLRDFALTNDLTQTKFPHDELGEIATKIIQNYQQLNETKKAIDLEHKKLLQHIYASAEGICFFSANHQVQFYNGLFIQYLNIIIDTANGEPTVVFNDPCFEKFQSFLINNKTENYFETQIKKQGKYFAVHVNVFEDKSFEIIINDITKQEKTRQLKQEMTSNIAHELRTPVTTIRGFLETILQQALPEEKKQNFIEKAYNQVLLLSELMQDMSLITKIEEAPQTFQLEKVNVGKIVQQLQSDLEIALQEKNISMQWSISDEIIVTGNRNLLYSIFRNLTENAIRYAGNDVTITITKYNEDKQYYYLSFADNGVGIADEQHFNRLFERFYRINEGRTRDTGGSGLGLSIVKNAVAFHKGTIVAKNSVGGGLEFLFKLGK